MIALVARDLDQPVALPVAQHVIGQAEQLSGMDGRKPNCS